MPSLDEIFYNEFNSSMLVRKANTLFDMNLPIDTSIITPIPARNQAVVKGICEEFYSKLNFNTENKEVVSLVGKQQLKRKIFMPDGKPRLEEDGKIRREVVPVPLGCAGVVSAIKIGVPKAFKPKEQLEYVDFIKAQDSEVKYIYIVPKKYLYKVNLCALVMSYNKLRSYYTMVKVALVNGHSVFISVIPFKPTYNNENKTYKIIGVKASANFDAEILKLFSFWEYNGIMFTRCATQLSEPVKGVYNCGVFHFVSTLDEYELYDREKSLEGNEEYY